jgi:hypothetical protein
MQEISKFTLQPLLAENDESDATHSKLLFESKLTDLELEGISLDAQYQYESKYLLFVSHNSPFADTLHIYLLNESFIKIDEWAISALSESEWYMLRNLKITDNNQIQFSFFGDDSWILTVLKEPQMTFPKLALLSSYWKPLRFAFAPGYLQLRATK